ncbi:FCF1 [Enterospora canceri]|uniref:FCF1 n=1 Tax=Enterospora canceri TaxID=1081671 RepID=A0A1Y1S8U8_9MICR|nr:FCF1 [Enterospora canceri]
MKYKKKEKEELLEADSSIEEKNILKYTLVDNLHRPPYQVILDTNFINDCIRKKIEPVDVLMEALNANVDIYITECVFGELEKLGRVFRIALNMIKRINHTRLICDHKGTYADNCLLNRVRMNKVFFVATSDVNLKQRITKKCGTPVLIFRGRKLVAENFHSLV